MEDKEGGGHGETWRTQCRRGGGMVRHGGQGGGGHGETWRTRRGGAW